MATAQQVVQAMQQMQQQQQQFQKQLMQQLVQQLGQMHVQHSKLVPSPAPAHAFAPTEYTGFVPNWACPRSLSLATS